jgi:hypothetical protein
MMSDTLLKKNFLMHQKTTQLNSKLPRQQIKSFSGLMRLSALLAMIAFSD